MGLLVLMLYCLDPWASQDFIEIGGGAWHMHSYRPNYFSRDMYAQFGGNFDRAVIASWPTPLYGCLYRGVLHQARKRGISEWGSGQKKVGAMSEKGGERVSFVEGWEFMQTLGEGAYGEWVLQLSTTLSKLLAVSCLWIQMNLYFAHDVTTYQLR